MSTRPNNIFKKNKYLYRMILHQNNFIYYFLVNLDTFGYINATDRLEESAINTFIKQKIQIGQLLIMFLFLLIFFKLKVDLIILGIINKILKIKF